MALNRYLTLTTALLLLALPDMYAFQNYQELDPVKVDESLGRFLVTVNGSNIITTPTFIVGVTLIGISLALLFGSAATAASGAATSLLASGADPGLLGLNLGKYKRSLSEDDHFILDMLNNFDFNNVECHKRIMCEIHQKTHYRRDPLGHMTYFIWDTFRNLRPGVNVDKHPDTKQYLEAADHGTEPKDCSNVYNTCRYKVSEKRLEKLKFLKKKKSEGPPKANYTAPQLARPERFKIDHL